MSDRTWKLIFAFIVILTAITLAVVKDQSDLKKEQTREPKTVAPLLDPSAIEHHKKVQAAMWEVAKVFGRDDGCRNADEALGLIIAEAAIKYDVPARDVAATVSVESDCNPYATSSRGAIGLMQVMPSVWKVKYDLQTKVNLLNPQQAVETGTEILADYEKKYGRQAGMLHYQGTGTGCATCDSNYVAKILRLADGK